MLALDPSLPSPVAAGHLWGGNQDIGREDEEQSLGARCWVCDLPACQSSGYRDSYSQGARLQNNKQPV